MRHPILRSSVFSLVLCALFSAGCRDREVTAYRIPKEKDPEIPAATPRSVMAATAAPTAPSTPAPSAPAAAPTTPSAAAANANMANTAVPTASGANLTWTAPAHWTSKPATSMRKATFEIKGEGSDVADLSITAFPGSTGGELANINRWRGQTGIQLPPLSETEAASAIARFESNGLKFAVVDFTGTGNPAQRVIGAIVPVGPSTWFFKLSGPAALLGREQAAFNAFLKTIRVPAATP